MWTEVTRAKHHAVFARDEHSGRCRLSAEAMQRLRLPIGAAVEVVLTLASQQGEGQREEEVAVLCTVWPDAAGVLGRESMVLDVSCVRCAAGGEAAERMLRLAENADIVAAR